MDKIARALAAVACIVPAVAYPSIRKLMDGFHQLGGGRAYSGVMLGDIAILIPFLLIVGCSIWPIPALMWITLITVIPSALLAGFAAATMPPIGSPFLLPIALFFVHFSLWFSRMRSSAKQPHERAPHR